MRRPISSHIVSLVAVTYEIASMRFWLLCGTAAYTEGSWGSTCFVVHCGRAHFVSIEATPKDGHAVNEIELFAFNAVAFLPYHCQCTHTHSGVFKPPVQREGILFSVNSARMCLGENTLRSTARERFGRGHVYCFWPFFFPICGAFRLVAVVQSLVNTTWGLFID